MARSHFPTDPDENAASIVNAAELVFGALDAAGARSVAEVGAFHGKSTRELLGWAEGGGARVVAIDPTPEPELRELAAERDDLELIWAMRTMFRSCSSRLSRSSLEIFSSSSSIFRASWPPPRMRRTSLWS